VPLSEDEQRILTEIEQHLYESDPKLVHDVSKTTVYTHAFRNMKWATLGFIAGVVLMVALLSVSYIVSFGRIPSHVGERVDIRTQRPSTGQGRPRSDDALDARRVDQERHGRGRSQDAGSVQPAGTPTRIVISAHDPDPAGVEKVEHQFLVANGGTAIARDLLGGVGGVIGDGGGICRLSVAQHSDRPH